MNEKQIRSAQVVLPCKNLNTTLEFFTRRLGFRLEMIFPADEPSIAVVSGHGLTLRLENSSINQPPAIRLLCDALSLTADTPREIYSPDEDVRVIFADGKSAMELREAKREFIVTAYAENSWKEGRARMQYRDLIPGRLGGRFIASHIRIPEGGPVPDYVHFHKIRFQMIYCLSGWARLVYEDQGEPFLMKAGDCVLQPPAIRHRVLETSAGFEVLEIGSPAAHETFAEYVLKLPNETFAPERIFEGQRFVHHVAAKTAWKKSEIKSIEARDAGIADAADGLAQVRTLRATADALFPVTHSGEFFFFYLLKGSLKLSDNQNKIYRLSAGDSFHLPAGTRYLIQTGKGSEMIQVRLPAEDFKKLQ